VFQDAELSDLVVCSLEELAEARQDFPDKAVLVEVESPFSRALNAGFDLNDDLSKDPESGNQRLDALVEETIREGDSALSGGADGIWYHLEGADPAHCSPMQYGGLYLERDRDILGRWQAGLNVVAVVGAEPYLDFVSDLPGAFFAYDSESSGVPTSAAKEIRQGPVASQARDADLRIVQSRDQFEAWTTDLEKVAAR